MPQIPKGLTPVDDKKKKNKADIPRGLVRMEVPSFVPGLSEEVQKRRAQMPSMLAPPVPQEGSAAGEFFRGVAGDKAQGFSGGAGEAIHGTFVDTPRAVYKAAVTPPTEDEKKRISKDAHRGPGLMAERLLIEPQRDQYLKSKKEAEQGHGTESFGHSVAAGTPVVGPMAAHFSERAAKGEVRDAIRES